MNELKNCPFCGGKPILYTSHISKYPFSVVACTDCSVTTTKYEKDHTWLGCTYKEAADLSKVEARTAWNRRAEPIALPMDIDDGDVCCPNCGRIYDPDEMVWMAEYCYECGQRISWAEIEGMDRDE